MFTSHIAKVVGVGILLWIINSIIFTLFIHPLAKYPGPLLTRLTYLYEFYQVRTGDHHIWLHKLHLKYGPVVRVGPNRLSYNTVEALHSIYSDHKAPIQKAGFTEAIALLKGGHRNLQTINDRHVYTKRRKLIAYAFSDEALQSSQKFILDRVQDWCVILRSKARDATSWTSNIDMKVWASLLTQDILGELCFGESFGACQAGSSDIDDLIENGSRQAQIMSWLPVPAGFFTLLGRVVNYGRAHKWESLRAQFAYDDRIDSMINRRMASTADRKDFLHYITQEDAETGESISRDELIIEAGVLFGAGVDTSATCIAACVYYLTQYPAVLAKVTAEVRGAFATVEDIVDCPALRSQSYLRGCIDEALRITPPVPGPLLRVVTSGGFAIQNDPPLPPGTEVSVPRYAIHHNEAYFPDSFAFKPERWADENLANKRAFCPFSNGWRSCVGRKLAYLDMMLALGRLVFLFDLRGVGEQEIGGEREGVIEYELKDWFITGRKGPIIQLRARS